MNGNGRVNGRLPRYHQIAQALRARIREGTLRPGARLETQRRLATSFGVTLMTLRQALELLEREHLISRRHGLGTFVAAPSIDYDILQPRRFAGDLSAKGEHVTTRLLAMRFSTPDRPVADALGLGPGARVLVVARLRLVDDHPMSLQCSFLPALIGHEIVRADLARTPLHQALQRTLGLAVEEALRIKEKRGQGEVVAVSLGPERVKEALRSCLAMGCDRAIHLNDPAWNDADTLVTSKALAAVVRQEAPQLLLCGRQAIDDDMGAVAAQLAELLGWPCAYWVMEEAIDADTKTVRAARQVEGGLEVFDLPLPAVLTAQKGLNEPRYPTLRGIMGAKKKEIRDVKAADLGWAPEPPQLSVVTLEAFPPRPPGRIIQGDVPTAVKELVRSLREEAKAI